MTQKIDFLFYSPDLESNQSLTPEDSVHAIRVLRKRNGDWIKVTDGKGGWFDCVITDANPKSCKIRIEQAVYDYNKPKQDIFIAICPVKNTSRIEYFLEKSVEIGISGFFFIKSKNTYPKSINNKRLEKIAISAMKQSLKAYKPFISELMSLEELLKNEDLGQKLIAHFDEDSVDLSNLNLESKITMLIGPEGDFTEKELEMAYKYGFKNVTLGQNRLRTETAGVYAVSVINSKGI